MAQLRDPDGRTILVKPHHLVGRSRTMDTALSYPDISASHAALTWTVEGWVVRDLGSRNGTFVNGARLEPGGVARLAAPAELRFGAASEPFQLLTDAPPAPTARSGERVVEGTQELLPLPSADNPLALLLYAPPNGWVWSREDGQAPVRDGETIDVDGAPWTLSLPEPIDATLEARPPSLEQVRVAFRVSSDEEFVEVRVGTEGVEHVLPSRAHQYLLVTLARARLEGRADGLPEGEQGWVYVDSLANMLRTRPNQIYVMIHRARREFEALGLPDGAQVVERRATAHQVRLGVADISVAQFA